MVISHYGLGMVKIQLGERVIVFNPIGKGTEVEPVKFGADLALVSLGDAACNGVEQVSRGERVPFVIDGPGEYEVEGVFVQGFATPGPGGRINTCYLMVLDGIRLVHLGVMAAVDLPDALVESLGAIDILFLPIDTGLLEPKAAAKMVNLLEPKAVVPVNFGPAALATFLREMGEESGQPLESWTLKKKDLADEGTPVVVIKSF